MSLFWLGLSSIGIQIALKNRCPNSGAAWCLQQCEKCGQWQGRIFLVTKTPLIERSGACCLLRCARWIQEVSRSGETVCRILMAALQCCSAAVLQCCRVGQGSSNGDLAFVPDILTTGLLTTHDWTSPYLQV